MNNQGGSAPECDQWAAAPGPANVASAGLPESAPKTGIPFKRIHAVVAGLFALGGILQTVWLFAGRLTVTSVTANYRFPQGDATFGIVIALFLAVAVCVALPASREFGIALALVVAVGVLGGFLHDLRLSYYLGTNTPKLSSVYGYSLLCVLAGGFTAGLEWRYRSLATPPARRVRRDRRLVRNQRLLCVLAGLFGAVPFVIGSALNSVSVSVQGVDSSYSCCTLAERTAWERADYFGFSAVLVAFVVFAAIDRSRTRSVAWLAGPAVLALSMATPTVAEVLWPAASFYGAGAGQSAHLHVTALAGFWLALIGALVLLGAAALRTRLDRSAAAPYRPLAPSAASA